MKKIMSFLCLSVLTITQAVAYVMVGRSTDTSAPDQTYGFNYTLDESAMTAEIIEAGNMVDPYEGDIEIPSEIIVDGKTYTVTSIGVSAFNSTLITSVVIPSSVKEIKQGAFQACYQLESVTLNDGLETLNWDVFAADPLLETIAIPGSVKTIPYNAFGNSGLRSVSFGSGVTTIEAAFISCKKLETVDLPETVETLSSSFEGCISFAEIKLPHSLRTIKETAFSETAITELDIPEGVTTLGSMAIGHMNGARNTNKVLKKIILPASLEKVEYSALNNLGALTDLVFNGDGSDLLISGYYTNAAKFLLTPVSVDGVCPITTLFLNRRLVDERGNDCNSTVFNTKTTLTDVTFGEQLSEVPNLDQCAAIRNVTVCNPDVPVAGGFHPDVYAGAVLHVPAGTAAAFRNAEIWKNFTSIEEAPVVTTIDAEKIRYVVGEGENLFAVVIRHGNPERLDNFVCGYRTDASYVSYSDMLEAFMAADSRFEVKLDGDKLASLSFDLDGNGIFDERDVIAAGNWSVSANMLASDNATHVIALCNGADVVEAPYYFYLPQPDETGVWVPEAMTVRLSDESFVLPVLVQPQGKNVTSTTNWQASSSNTSYRLDRTKIITPYTFIDGSYHARPTLVGATGVVYVRYRPSIGGKYTESNYMTLTIDAPEVPMTSFAFAEDEIRCPLNKVVEYEYTFEPENATYTAITLSPSDKTIATWSASAGLKTTTKAGTTTITASSNYDSDVKASFSLVSSLQKPVASVNFGPGTEDGVINVPVKQLIGLRPVIEPADADIPTVSITLSDNGSSKADYTCTTYNVNYWDVNNVRSQFLELSGHRPTGDHPAKITVKSTDGAYTGEFVVNVIETDRTPLPNGYEDGTIILNEEWFGHTNGGLNYITEDDELIYQAYERENPGMSFGCTSQYGTIWAGKLIVMSKQAADGGDVLPGGGRLVIADAKTLKRIGSLDVLSYDGKSGDGRAVAGATPEKIYAGTNNGIYIVDIKDPANPVVTGRIGLSDSDDLYSGQIGDMVTARNHVFAVMQSGGLMIIDVDTDEVEVISDTNVQGVTQSADGNVWYCTVGKDDAGSSCSVFVALDPVTLKEIDRVSMPASIGTVACGWGAWRSTAFKGAVDGNDLWFVTGAAGIMGGASGDYYRYTIGDDPGNIRPFFSLNGVLGETGFGEEVAQMTYGTPCFDARNNRLVVMTGRKNAASGGYRDHWIHFVDGDSREITKTFKLNPYYWFQSLPIFPDKYAPEIEIDDFEFIVGDEKEEREIIVTDQDNIDSNIMLSLEEADDNAAAAADVVLNGRSVSVTPLSAGVRYLTVMAQSNGKTASKTFAVKVKDKPVGIDDVEAATGVISCNGRDVTFSGFSGTKFALYDMAGHYITDIEVDSDLYVARLGYAAGIYILRGAKGETAKIALN